MRSMWILVMFDLPVDTPEAKAAYREFHDFLLDEGYLMLQYSVYARPCASEEVLDVHESRAEKRLPDDGQVRILKFTDSQYARMKTFYGKIRGPTEKAPDQLTFL